MVNQNACKVCGTDIDVDEQYCEKHKPNKKYEVIIKIVTDAKSEDEAEDKAWEYICTHDKDDFDFFVEEVLQPQWENGQQVESI